MADLDSVADLLRLGLEKFLFCSFLCSGCQLILTKYPQLVNVPYLEAGVQPIHFATDEGHLDVVKFLVECVSFFF